MGSDETMAATGLSGRIGETPPVLVAEALVKRFGGVAAVDGVSLSVGAGEIVGLIGPNGAGKTTLFDCLAGEQKPSSGRVLINGRAVESAAPNARLKDGLGRTFQIPRPFPGMTRGRERHGGRAGPERRAALAELAHARSASRAKSARSSQERWSF